MGAWAAFSGPRHSKMERLAYESKRRFYAHDDTVLHCCNDLVLCPRRRGGKFQVYRAYVQYRPQIWRVVVYWDRRPAVWPSMTSHRPSLAPIARFQPCKANALGHASHA